MKFLKFCLSVAVCLTAIASPWWPASAFALRGIEVGGKVPDIELSGVTVEGGKLSSFAGPRGLVVVYWATWSSRSPAILQFARRARLIVLAGFAVSIVYNAVGLTYALSGHLTPLASAVLMPVSSITIIALSSGLVRFSARRMLPA